MKTSHLTKSNIVKKSYKVISITVDKELHDLIKPLLKKSRLPLGKLLDDSIRDTLINKYGSIEEAKKILERNKE